MQYISDAIIDAEIYSDLPEYTHIGTMIDPKQNRPNMDFPIWSILLCVALKKIKH
jgi:hypothetical protein